MTLKVQLTSTVNVLQFPHWSTHIVNFTYWIFHPLQYLQHFNCYTFCLTVATEQKGLLCTMYLKVPLQTHLADSSKETDKKVSIIVGRLALQHGTETFKAHASVNVMSRKIQQWTIRLPNTLIWQQAQPNTKYSTTFYVAMLHTYIHTHVNCFMALFRAYLGGLIPHIHSPINMIPAALQHGAEPTHTMSIHDKSVFC